MALSDKQQQALTIRFMLAESAEQRQTAGYVEAVKEYLRLVSSMSIKGRLEFESLVDELNRHHPTFQVVSGTYEVEELSKLN
jgi:hypothetical protein